MNLILILGNGRIRLPREFSADGQVCVGVLQLYGFDLEKNYNFYLRNKLEGIFNYYNHFNSIWYRTYALKIVRTLARAKSHGKSKLK